MPNAPENFKTARQRTAQQFRHDMAQQSASRATACFMVSPSTKRMQFCQGFFGLLRSIFRNNFGPSKVSRQKKFQPLELRLVSVIPLGCNLAHSKNQGRIEAPNITNPFNHFVGFLRPACPRKLIMSCTGGRYGLNLQRLIIESTWTPVQS